MNELKKVYGTKYHLLPKLTKNRIFHEDKQKPQESKILVREKPQSTGPTGPLAILIYIK